MLKALQERRFKRTTDSHHQHLIAPNLLDHDFAFDRPDQKWDTNIRDIWTAEGWHYLAIVLDLYSRRIVGWAVSDKFKKDLATAAFVRTITIRETQPGLIHHSDRGSQYCSYEYRDLLNRHDIIASIRSKGNCYDNAMVETIFMTIKNELVWRTIFQSRKKAQSSLENTSTGSTIRVVAIQHWDINRPSNSRPKWQIQNESLPTKMEQVQCDISRLA